MKGDRWFWLALPICILASGNFTPFRLGPLTPISLVISLYLLVNMRSAVSLLLRSPVLLGALGLLCLYELFAIGLLLVNPPMGVTGFSGAPPFLLYSAMFFARMILTLLFLATFVDRTAGLSTVGLYALWASYGLLVGQLVLQATLMATDVGDVGYVFSVGSSFPRLGGFFGEPQTIAAWIFCIFFVLYNHYYPRGLSIEPLSIVLVVSLLISLALTFSTTWIIVLGLSIFLRSPLPVKLALAAGVFALLWIPQLPVLTKALHEYTHIGERSITVVAGWQIYARDPLNLLFGYGPGMSPYTMYGADIFQHFPSLNLSHLGRQNVMNSYAELLFESGAIFSIIYLVNYLVAANVRTLRSLINILPVLLGIFSVGGGLYAGYFVLALAVMGVLDKGEIVSTSRTRQSGQANKLNQLDQPGATAPS